MELNIIRSNKVTVQDIKNMLELDKYELPERTYNYYKQYTNGNDFISIEECKKKLIRNVLLGREAPVKVGFEKVRVFYYGCLTIMIDIEDRSFSYIKNEYGVDYGFKLDIERRIVLNYILGIKNDKY